MAIGCFTVAPLAVRFGKRPIWLGCMTVFFVCLIWAAASQSYASLLVARLLASWAGKWLYAMDFLVTPLRRLLMLIYLHRGYKRATESCHAQRPLLLTRKGNPKWSDGNGAQFRKSYRPHCMWLPDLVRRMAVV
jgi:hypothetical protein